MVEVVNIADSLPEVDKELVSTLRSLLSEAMNGRLRSYIALYVSGDGEQFYDSHYFKHYVDQVALERFIRADEMTDKITT